jgi:hypothetical protein
MRHSTENLANLKRQIRSKALAARGGTAFGGSFRRTSHIQQLQQQGNLQTQPAQGAYQIGEYTTIRTERTYVPFLQSL